MGARIPSLELRWPVVPAVHVGHFFAAMAPMSGDKFLFPIHGVATREEYVPNERIVDRSSLGPTWTFTFEPDPTGTQLTLTFEYPTKVPLVGMAVDPFAWNGDRDIDTMLDFYKRQIEA